MNKNDEVKTMLLEACQVALNWAISDKGNMDFIDLANNVIPKLESAIKKATE